MKTLYVNKKNILEDFAKLSKTWETSENILLRLDIEQVDTKLVIKYLLGKLPNDLA